MLQRPMCRPRVLRTVHRAWTTLRGCRCSPGLLPWPSMCHGQDLPQPARLELSGGPRLQRVFFGHRHVRWGSVLRELGQHSVHQQRLLLQWHGERCVLQVPKPGGRHVRLWNSLLVALRRGAFGGDPVAGCGIAPPGGLPFTHGPALLAPRTTAAKTARRPRSGKTGRAEGPSSESRERAADPGAGAVPSRSATPCWPPAQAALGAP
jgi:hypothetical protein